MSNTDIFSWQCVPGASDKTVVYENVGLITANYLRHGYIVILSGLILTNEEAGAIARLRTNAERDGGLFADSYCGAPIDVVADRSDGRAKKVPDEHVRQWWALAEADRSRVDWPLHQLDMRRPLSENAATVLALLGEAT